ncbi:MAG: type VII secretion protein EccB [Kutzneria sp.]|nr:type VII secretion protein EccB [Kutzneria sp.]
MLRRMESALVRRDAVMLHDPMSSHIRAAAIGILLAMVIAVGFILFGVLNPSGALPSDSGVVIGKQSGAVYALVKDQNTNQKRLIPTFNVTSARLLLLAQAGAGSTANAATPPAVVDDEVLKGVDRGKKQGIVDVPQLLPSPGQQISDDWAVCDTVDLAKTPDPVTGEISTSVIAGVADVGTEISVDRPVLVVTPDRTYYLVYRIPPKYTRGGEQRAGISNADVVRAKVTMTDNTLTQTYKLFAADARPVSSAVLNAIPQVADLQTPAIDAVNQSSPFTVNDPRIGAARIGAVLHDTNGTGDEHYYVLLKNGKHEISPAVATLLVTSNADQGSEYQVHHADTVNVPNDDTLQPYDDFPQRIGNVVDATESSTTCFAWHYRDGRQHSMVTVAPDMKSIIKDKTPIRLGSPGTAGAKVTDFYMPTGQAAVVHGSTSAEEDRMAGPLYVISDLGVKYGIASSVVGMSPAQVADGLGLGDPSTYPPAPDQIVGLLPAGSALDPAAALRTYDSMTPPTGVGAYPTVSSTPGG